MVETVDQVAEVIEQVAEGVEKVADEIGDNLAEGGKLRGAFDSIENAARKAADGAHLVDQILDKVFIALKISFIYLVSCKAGLCIISPSARPLPVAPSFRPRTLNI